MSNFKLIPQSEITPGYYIAQKILSFKSKNSENFKLPEIPKIIVKVEFLASNPLPGMSGLRVYLIGTSASRPLSLFRFYRRVEIEGLLTLHRCEPEYSPLLPGETLFDADENCTHEVYAAQGGGIKCRKCLGWFCF